MVLTIQLLKHDWESLVHFLQCGTLTRNSKNLSPHLGREWESQKGSPAVWDMSGKSKKAFQLFLNGESMRRREIFCNGSSRSWFYHTHFYNVNINILIKFISTHISNIRKRKHSLATTTTAHAALVSQS